MKCSYWKKLYSTELLFEPPRVAIIDHESLKTVTRVPRYAVFVGVVQVKLSTSWHNIY